MAPTLHTLCDHPFVAVPICLATAQGNAEITEGIAPTITAAAGMSGNNQPMVTVPVVMGGGNPQAVDFYNGQITGGKTMTLCAGRNDPHKVPCALIPYTLKIRSGCDGGGREP